MAETISINTFAGLPVRLHSDLLNLVEDNNYVLGCNFDDWQLLVGLDLIETIPSGDDIATPKLRRWVSEFKQAQQVPVRPTQIRADQWEQVAADVAAGRCKANCEGESIINIVNEPVRGWEMTAWYTTGEKSGIARLATIYLEWLTPATPASATPEPIVIAGNNADREAELGLLVKKGEKIKAVRLYRRIHAEAGLAEAIKAVDALIIAARPTVDQLQAELAKARADLAAAQAQLKTHHETFVKLQLIAEQYALEPDETMLKSYTAGASEALGEIVTMAREAWQAIK